MSKQLSAYEKCDVIRNMLLARAAETMMYNWSDEYKAAHMHSFPEVVKEYKEGDQLFNINPSDLTIKQLKELGFGLWEGEEYLIPLWLFPFIQTGVAVKTINGKTLFFTQDLDTDNRFGLTAYIVTPKETTPHLSIVN